ncbi:hypothetical protein [Pseudarthrobacter sp. NamE5]|uniref:hypothetical protein n=1 Tax=Pseudarthrobacter sp. NamE5 TaxID=2576839 RepID=UPI00110AD35D|nr:hypothetical protein [Pseudarthrobacter sp. NamE5]TLM86006.1 hypothetical protein FDW84_06935 [Pseudarthrobacter sp. NamE5]
MTKNQRPIDGHAVSKYFSEPEESTVDMPGPVGVKNSPFESVRELFQYAYENPGRKLVFPRTSLFALSSDEQSKQDEVLIVKNLAKGDPYLAVPPTLLAAVAQQDVDHRAVQRILELVVVALAENRVFEQVVRRLASNSPETALTAQDISALAEERAHEALGLKKSSEVMSAQRQRLRVNAVITFELFQILREQWTEDQFVKDMATLIWRTSPSTRISKGTAALLATAKNTEALGRLSRHFEQHNGRAKRATADALAQRAFQERRAEHAESARKTLATELDASRAQIADLEQTLDSLGRELRRERSNRAVDKSHHVDDYEALRTLIIRRLTAQVELLSDGLHALRHGSTQVAEEFVDRALNAIDTEVTRLKDTSGGTQ